MLSSENADIVLNCYRIFSVSMCHLCYSLVNAAIVLAYDERACIKFQDFSRTLPSPGKLGERENMAVKCEGM